MSQDESIVEGEYCTWLGEMKYGIALKLVLLNLVGWPDRTIFLQGGKVLFIEFKDGNNTLSGPQIYWKKIIKGLGFRYEVCYTLKKAKRVTETTRLSK